MSCVLNLACNFFRTKPTLLQSLLCLTPMKVELWTSMSTCTPSVFMITQRPMIKWGLTFFFVLHHKDLFISAKLDFQCLWCWWRRQHWCWGTQVRQCFQKDLFSFQGPVDWTVPACRPSWWSWPTSGLLPGDQVTHSPRPLFLLLMLLY